MMKRDDENSNERENKTSAQFKREKSRKNPRRVNKQQSEHTIERLHVGAPNRAQGILTGRQVGV